VIGRALAAIARVALALWIGAVACVGALVAPALFRRLDAAPAGDLLEPIFRAVDLFGIGAAVVCVAAHRGWRRLVAAAMGALAALNALLLGPRIAARAEPFALYHRASEIAWGLILVSGVVMLAAASPRGSAGRDP
jgi:hypothetical protein